MVFDDAKVYGYGRKPQYYRWTTPMEYQLFAAAKQPELVSMSNPKPAPAPASSDAKRGGGQKPGSGQQAEQKKPATTKKKRGTAAQAPASRITCDWTQDVPVLVRAMVLADKTLFIAGPPDVVDEERTLSTFDQSATQKQLARQAAALEGADGALLWAVSATDGTKLAEHKLRSVPLFDGMAAAGGRLYMATIDGKVLCLGGK